MFNKSLDSFEARLKRLAAEGAGQSRLMAGEGALGQTQISAGALKRASRRSARANGAWLWAVPRWALAFGLGLVAMGAGRLFGFHVLGPLMGEETLTVAAMRPVGELAIGLVVLLTLAMAIGLRGHMAKGAMLAGLAVMGLGEAELAGRLPGLWESLFSPAYAAQVLGERGGVAQELRALAGVLHSSL